jgi:S-formylglutathione hydrolase
LEISKRHKSFAGEVLFCQHHAESIGSKMNFSIFLPPGHGASPGRSSVLYWLSGLTCTEENFMVKAGALKFASQNNLVIICPDTSPRGLNLPGEDDSWDFGTGAGFYLNATSAPFENNYQMYDYVAFELPNFVEKEFRLQERRAISGHSMGGHGAMTIALKNPERYLSVSAFAPIANPINCPWGQKAFLGYLGDDRESWRSYDTCELIKKTESKTPLLIEQGLGDEHLQGQLGLDALKTVCSAHDYPIEIKLRDGYDHGYFFISSFIEEHMTYHLQHF